MSSAAPAALPHLLSLLRPALGAAVVASFDPSSESVLLLPLVLLGCASDWLDGEVARRLGSQTRAGRIVDNLSDFFFLLCFFWFFALAGIWSPRQSGRLLALLPWANYLPVFALLASFGCYFVRLLREFAAGREPERSPRGHAAGVGNYGLAIAGAAKMLPEPLPESLRWIALGPFLEAAMLAVVLLNVAAVFENLALMFHRRPAGPRMPA